MANKPKSYFLIGSAQEEIRCTRRPPTLRQILQSFVFYHLEKGENKKSAASSVIKNAMIIWNELEMKTRRVDKCEEKMIKQYDEWMHLSKYHNVHSVQSQQINEQIVRFTDRLDQKFDVEFIEASATRKQSTGEEMVISETNAEMEDETTFEMGLQEAEVEPCTSGESGFRVRKRSSAMEAEENVKNLFAKSTNIDEEGEKSILLFSDFFSLVLVNQCIAI